MLVFFDIADITDVPRLPHPIIPKRIAEFAFDAKTTEGRKIVAAEIIAALLTNILLFIN